MFDFGSLFAGFFIIEWIIRVIMLFLVPRKLRPTTANAWLLLILVAPIVGTLLFYAFGAPKLPRARREKLRKVNSLTTTELDQLARANQEVFTGIQNENLASISRLATKLGGLPPMRGNTIDFLSDYEQNFQAIAQAIDGAEEYVHIQYFIASYDDSTKVVFDALDRAVDRGLTVRFMFDKVVSRRYSNVRKLKKVLQKHGIEAVEMMPLRLIPGRSFTRPDLRNHRKVVIIDGTTAFSGSQNLIHTSYGKKNVYYEDIVAKFQGPVVWQLNNTFRADWFAETGQPLLDVVEDEDMPQPVGGAVAQVLPSGPSFEHDNNLKLYTAMVYAAQKEVRIVVPYFIPDESLLDALTAAAQRGVKVSMINSEVIDNVFAGHAQRSYYDELLSAGVELYLYKKPIFLHTKQVIIDGSAAIVGSSNLDIRSFELNFEINTIVYDAPTIQRLVELENKYFEHSWKISHEYWKKRHVGLKMLDSVARLTAALQ